MNKALRYIGLALVTLVAGFYGFILIGGIFESNPEPMTLESISMMILGSLTLISAILSWFRMPIGAWLALGVGVLFSAFALVTAGSNHLLAVMVSGGPLIIGGGLMLLGLRLKQP